MQLSMTNGIGYVATAIGTPLMMPQVIKALRTRKMTDVALGTPLLYFFNCLLWMIYGIRIGAPPIFIANSIGLAISIVQLVLKLKLG